MSDQDLRNLYENVRRGDVYTGPKRLENMYREVSETGFEDDEDGEDVVGFFGDPDMVQSMQSQHNPFGASRTPAQDNAIKELIEDWIGHAGFDSGQVTNIVLGAVDGVVTNDWLDLQNFVKDSESSGKGKNSLQLPVDQPLVNIDEPLKEQLRKFIIPEHVDDVYSTLFAAAFAESTVAVGRGELILALLTSCTKGSIGDVEYFDRDEVDGKPSEGLKMGAIQVEVKTGRGRAISGRGGGFRNANVALESAIMSGLDENENIKSDPMMKTSKSGKNTITGFNVQENLSLMSIEQFVDEVKGVDDHLGDHNWFTDTSSDLAILLGGEEAKVESDEQKRAIRHVATLACMLLGYANRGEHFRYMLLIKQAGSNATTKIPASMSEDSFVSSAFVDCSTLKSIYDQMTGDGPLLMDRGGMYTAGVGGKQKALDGEGVYIGYAGSNTNIDALSQQSRHSSQRARDAAAARLKPSSRRST